MKQAIYTPLPTKESLPQQTTWEDDIDAAVQDYLASIRKAPKTEDAAMETPAEAPAETIPAETTTSTATTGVTSTTPFTLNLGNITSNAQETYNNRIQKVLDYLTSKGLKFRVTSNIRNTRTSSGHNSRHNYGLAADIVPEDFVAFKKYIAEDKDLQNELNKYGAMMYAEDTPEMLRVTGGTGNHIHFSFNPTGKGYEFQKYRNAWLWNPDVVSMVKNGKKLPKTKPISNPEPQGAINEMGIALNTNNPYIVPGWDYSKGFPNE